jgi:hypothetical protein
MITQEAAGFLHESFAQIMGIPKLRSISIWVSEINMANGTKGKGRAPPSGLPPRGGQTACPPHPLGNFYGLVYCVYR